MENFLRAFFENFTLSFFLVGMLLATWKLRRRSVARQEFSLWQTYFSQYLFWSIGVSFLYNAFMHTFFGEMTAAFIGWENSPFQTEVGLASLGFAIVGFFAFLRPSRDLRFAAVIGPSCFTIGATVVHGLDMVRSHNFSPGNAGTVFYTDILIPLAGFFLLWRTRPKT